MSGQPTQVEVDFVLERVVELVLVLDQRLAVRVELVPLDEVLEDEHHARVVFHALPPLSGLQLEVLFVREPSLRHAHSGMAAVDQLDAQKVLQVHDFVVGHHFVGHVFLELAELERVENVGLHPARQEVRVGDVFEDLREVLQPQVRELEDGLSQAKQHEKTLPRLEAVDVSRGQPRRRLVHEAAAHEEAVEEVLVGLGARNEKVLEAVQVRKGEELAVVELVPDFMEVHGW